VGVPGEREVDIAERQVMEAERVVQQ
jgi:hypothetical protein